MSPYRLPWRVAPLFVCIAVAGDAAALECGSSKQFRVGVLAVLEKAFPEERFRPGASEEIILLDGWVFRLENLRRRVCSAPPPLTEAQQAEVVKEHFDAARTVRRMKEAVPREWADARDRVLPQLLPRAVAESLEGIVWRPLTSDVATAIVIDVGPAYGYVSEERRAGWHVDRPHVFKQAVSNLDRQSHGVSLRSRPGADRVVMPERSDGYLAVQILAPSVREAAAKVLGEPFLAAIPNRDFLVMWSTQSSGEFQAFARSRAERDFREQDHPLTPRVLRVWKNGRVEEVR
ncbi:MAG TPA: hypothetical protein VIV57_14300 [Anaeromyxobacter sp.]